MDIKTQHEQAVCNTFLTIYNKLYSTTHQFERLGNPRQNEPDCICTNGLNVEIATAYINENEAKDLWELTRCNLSVDQYNNQRQTIVNPDQQWYDSINDTVQKHCDSKYSYQGELILVIAEQSPLVNKQQINEYVNAHKNFNNTISTEIWLLYRGAFSSNGIEPKEIIRLS